MEVRELLNTRISEFLTRDQEIELRDGTSVKWSVNDPCTEETIGNAIGIFVRFLDGEDLFDVDDVLELIGNLEYKDKDYLCDQLNSVMSREFDAYDYIEDFANNLEGMEKMLDKANVGKDLMDAMNLFIDNMLKEKSEQEHENGLLEGHTSGHADGYKEGQTDSDERFGAQIRTCKAQVRARDRQIEMLKHTINGTERKRIIRKRR